MGRSQLRRRGDEERSRKILLAGLWTETCIALPTIQAIHDGYEIYVVEDCCGDISALAHTNAMQRMVQAGAKPVTALSVILEWQRDWAHRGTYDAIMDIAKTHFGAYGVGVEYAYTMVHGAPVTRFPEYEVRSRLAASSSRMSVWPTMSAITTRVSRSELAMTVLRVSVGLMIAGLHGLHKVVDGFQYLTAGRDWPLLRDTVQLGFPLPVVFASAAAVIQLAGGLLIAGGGLHAPRCTPGSHYNASRRCLQRPNWRTRRSTCQFVCAGYRHSCTRHASTAFQQYPSELETVIVKSTVVSSNAAALGHKGVVDIVMLAGFTTCAIVNSWRSPFRFSSQAE